MTDDILFQIKELKKKGFSKIESMFIILILELKEINYKLK